MRPSHWLPIALFLVLLPALEKPPVVDEESYLAIAAQIASHLDRPYDWWRNWQPWGASHPENAFLFAHPPLHLWWVAICQKWVTGFPMMRLAVALPWLLLLGWGVGRLAEGMTLRGSRAALLWLACPLVVMAVHAGLMMDLALAALMTATVACWWSFCDERQREWGWAAGGFLALAGAMKYPGLVLAPVLLLHARRQGLVRVAWPVWLGFAVLWGGLQGWLALEYGTPHLWAVLSSAGEIARGGWFDRSFGVWVRLGLVVCPLVLVAEKSLVKGAGLGALVAAVALPLAMGPDALHPLEMGLLVGLGAAAGGVLVPAVEGLKRSADSAAWLLGAWAVASVLAVAVGHNYSGGRYLLPATVPLVLGLHRVLERSAAGMGWGRVGIAAWAVLGTLMATAELRQARAVSGLAAEVARQHPVGRFAGEWTFRWRMAREGWQVWTPGEPLEAGEVLAVPVNSGPFEVPADRLRLLEQLTTPEKFPLRVLDQPARDGYHGETLGILPGGLSTSPLERVRVYEVLW